jgi:Arc/MetJ-type ribon-helix-helix transcriptional regulator
MMTWYDDVMRTIIELPNEQLDELDALCEREGISRAEAVRRSVQQYLHTNRAAHAHKAFGIWRGRAVEGLAYEAALRREWDAPAKSPAKRR